MGVFDICIDITGTGECEDDDDGFLRTTSLMVAWGYRAAFGVRPGRKVWFDVTPRLGIEFGGIKGLDTALIGAEIGFDFNIHINRALIGVGGYYEILKLTNGRAVHGANFMLIRLGGAF